MLVYFDTKILRYIKIPWLEDSRSEQCQRVYSYISFAHSLNTECTGTTPEILHNLSMAYWHLMATYTMICSILNFFLILNICSCVFVYICCNTDASFQLLLVSKLLLTFLSPFFSFPISLFGSTLCTCLSLCMYA